MCKLKTFKPKTNVKLRDYSRYDLAYVRESLGLTLEDVAKVIGCGKQVLSDIETGRACNLRSPTKFLYGIVLERICEERGVTFDEVLSSTEYFVS